ncbi:MAG: sporulation protein YunB [Lawsonibacter sp.]
MGLLEARLRPMAVTIAQAQLQNDAARLVERCVTEDLASGADIRRTGLHPAGRLRGHRLLTTDMAAMNLLRAELVELVLDALEGVGVFQLRIPWAACWTWTSCGALGPPLQVHAHGGVGTADARFSSELFRGEVNQTLHRIELELTVPMTLLLPGGPVETESVTRLCVAETVIVGRVPDAYLQMELPGGG